MSNSESNSSAASLSMESAIAKIVGRILTDEERHMLMVLRDQYGYNDDDPLVVVLAMTGAIKIMAEEIPGKLAAAARETIELHQQTLRNQSMIVARDVVASVAEIIHSASRSRKDRVIDALIGGGVGVLLSMVAFVILKKLGTF